VLQFEGSSVARGYRVKRERPEKCILLRSLLAARVIGAITTALVASTVLSTAVADDACALKVTKLRYDDDYACFRDPRARDSSYAVSKFVPWNKDDSVFASFGGSARGHYEYTRNPDFGASRQDKNGALLKRYTLHGDFHLGSHVRVYGEVLSAAEKGRVESASPVDENQLTIENGFLDIAFGSSSHSVTIRSGIQEMSYGSARLVDVRDGPNVRRTFTAVRVIANLPGWRVDAIAAAPRTPQYGILDDRTNRDQSLYGLYAASRDHQFSTGELDLYALAFEDAHAVYAEIEAAERRHSIGARFHGDGGRWDWDWESIYQFGSFGESDIDAWTIASETGFTFQQAAWRPKIALSANVASGDHNPSDKHIGTFNALFPKGNYFSEAAVLGPRNFYNLHPKLELMPGAAWSITADVDWFWRQETRDAVYTPSGQVLRTPDGSRKRDVGTSFSLESNYEIKPNMTLTAIYSRFMPGSFLQETGPSSDIEYYELTLDFKF
tara:strand:- start:4260 stop:5747 length:1488 start_codon:yes stop_codon:yes gene_type:complete